jgi:uncharacterized protein YndB with AHSA1/START domain
MPDIMHLIKIHASPEQVYQAPTTAEGIRNWWTSDADLDSKIGASRGHSYEPKSPAFKRESIRLRGASA